MKKLRKNSGFTIVECVVAMAVLAVMALGLMMILNATVRQRNLNTQLERDVDSQVDKVIRNTAGGTLVDVDDIKLSDSISITGVKKIYFDDAGSNLQIGALQIDGDAPLPPVANPKPGGNNGGSPLTAGNRYRVYGTARLKNDCITLISQQGSTSVYEHVVETKKNEDGTEVKEEYDIYAVTWRIDFTSYGDGTDTRLTEVVNMGAVKVVFPGKPIAYTPNSGNIAHVYYLGENTVRIEPSVLAKDAENHIQVDIEFLISEKDYSPSLIQNHFGSTSPEINKELT